MKKLNFKSIVKLAEIKDLQEIDFDVILKRLYKNKHNFQILEFEDPKDAKINNRIEISQSKVNIFSGPSTLNLELQKDLEIEYVYNEKNETIHLTSFLEKVTKNDFHDKGMQFIIEYILKHEKKIIGNYKLILTIT